jgi:hypothetical protein
MISCFCLERCVAVLSPFLAKRFCTAQSARRSVYILLAVSLIFLTTRFFLYHDRRQSLERKECQLRPNSAEFYRVSEIILFIGIPDLLLLSNIFTICSLFKRRRQQQQTPSLDESSRKTSVEMRVNDVHTHRKQRQVTIMLVTVNIAFYTFTTPAMIIYLMETYAPKDLDVNQKMRIWFLGQCSVPLFQLPNAVRLSRCSNLF